MIKFSVQMMNVGGEESLTAPAREMLLKLIIYATRHSRHLAKPSDNWYSFHCTAGLFLVSQFLLLVGVLLSVGLLTKMLSHFHRQKSPVRPVREQTANFRSRSRSVVFPGKNKDILQQ